MRILKRLRREVVAFLRPFLPFGSKNVSPNNRLVHSHFYERKNPLVNSGDLPDLTYRGDEESKTPS